MGMFPDQACVFIEDELLSCLGHWQGSACHLISQSHSPWHLAPSSQISLHQTSGLPLGFHRVLGSIKVLPFLRPIALSPFLLRNYLHVGLFVLFKFKQQSLLSFIWNRHEIARLFTCSEGRWGVV